MQARRQIFYICWLFNLPAMKLCSAEADKWESNTLETSSSCGLWILYCSDILYWVALPVMVCVQSSCVERKNVQFYWWKKHHQLCKNHYLLICSVNLKWKDNFCQQTELETERAWLFYHWDYSQRILSLMMWCDQSAIELQISLCSGITNEMFNGGWNTKHINWNITFTWYAFGSKIYLFSSISYLQSFLFMFLANWHSSWGCLFLLFSCFWSHLLNCWSSVWCEVCSCWAKKTWISGAAKLWVQILGF